MADINYETLYNRILDISAGINIPLKSFAIYVVVRYTPQNLRHYSYFILNTMIWNFLANFVFAFMHLYPLFPAICFRVDGISSHFIDNEVFGQSMFILMFFLISECAFAFLFAFPHRYIVFVHPNFAARIRPAWVFALCGATHVIFALFYFPLVNEWTISYEDYPNKAELPARPFVFCFYPNGIRKIAIVAAYWLVTTVGCGIFAACSFLFLRNVRKLKTSIIYDNTLALQKRLFASLLMLTVITLFFGGIPLVFSISLTMFPYTSHAREATLVSNVFLANYGSISAIAYLVSFKAYREAVKRIFSSSIGRFTRRNTKVRSIGLNC